MILEAEEAERGTKSPATTIHQNVFGVNLAHLAVNNPTLTAESDILVDVKRALDR